jgi:three-Cys-motif partner protein
MVKSADHFENFEAHTLLKHAIFRYYLERWSRILLLRHFSMVRVVDACAGSGGDGAGHPGSPLIALAEARKAVADISGRRGERVEVQVVAVEKKLKWYRELVNRMSSHSVPHEVLLGTLADYIDRFVADAKKVPTLFFIDPFGMQPLQAAVVQKALGGPKNELFLLFADQAALRHIGAADAVAEESDTDMPDLFGDVPSPAPLSAEQVRAADSSEEILDAAYGPLDWRAAARVPRQQRRRAMVELYCELLRRFGAARVLPVPILDARKQLKYHLIYATHSPRGYDVMKDSVRRGLEARLVGAEHHMQLGAAVPTADIERDVRAHFAGKIVPWSAGPGETVTGYALQDTPAMPWQVKILKQSLKPFKVLGAGPQTYSFPALS